jgi:cell division septum initiation protein DivIVA
MPIRPEDLTVSGLPRSALPGGLKTDAAADLLERAAFDYRTVLTQAQQLGETARQQALRIEELEAQIASLESDVAARGEGTEAIGKALLAATRAGEEIAAEARVSAERITTEAEAHAAALLEQATKAAEERERESIAAREKLGIERELLDRERTRVLGEAQERAETILADARRDAEQLQAYRERLRSLLTDSRNRLVELAESALSQLEEFDAKGGFRRPDLLDDLRPPDGEPPSQQAKPDAEQTAASGAISPADSAAYSDTEPPTTP